MRFSRNRFRSKQDLFKIVSRRHTIRTMCIVLYLNRLKFTAQRYNFIDKSGNDNRHDSKRSVSMREIAKLHNIMYIVYWENRDLIFSMSMMKIYSALVIASREMFKIWTFDDGDETVKEIVKIIALVIVGYFLRKKLHLVLVHLIMWWSSLVPEIYAIFDEKKEPRWHTRARVCVCVNRAYIKYESCE